MTLPEQIGDAAYKKLVYIAGPYRAATPFQIQKNIREAAEIGLKYWKLGYAVIVPHMNTALLDHELPDDAWLTGDFEMIRRCDYVVVSPRWRQSSGTIAEIDFARAHNIPVYFE